MLQNVQLVWFKSLVVATVILAGCTAGHAQGNYAPVTTKDLVEAKFNHYYGANRKAVMPPDFSWNFTATNLVIKTAQGSIAPDLIERLAAGKNEVKTIEAEWKVEHGELVISRIKVDGQPTRTLAKLPAFRTAPTLIRIGERQYVFVPKS